MVYLLSILLSSVGCSPMEQTNCSSTLRICLIYLLGMSSCSTCESFDFSICRVLLQVDSQVANHSATVSSFDEPCVRNMTYFDSGLYAPLLLLLHPLLTVALFSQPVTNKTDFLRIVAFTVTETTPTWMYCRQPGTGPKTHCQQGMVFAINPTPEKTFSQFLMNALKSTVQNKPAPPA